MWAWGKKEMLRIEHRDSLSFSPAVRTGTSCPLFMSEGLEIEKEIERFKDLGLVSLEQRYLGLPRI
jgi:hypothetical protein